MDSTLDHSHLATEVQHGENELHMRKQCDTYAKLEIRTDTTLESHGKLYAKVSHPAFPTHVCVLELETGW